MLHHGHQVIKSLNFYFWEANLHVLTFSAKSENLKLIKQSNYLTAKEPEQRVAHIPPMVAPGPACQKDLKYMKIQIAKMTC